MPTNENKPLATSRLPRPASSPDKALPTLTLKRKATDDGPQRPTKAPALSTSITNRPQGLRASQSQAQSQSQSRGFAPTSTAANTAAARRREKQALTLPKAPALTRSTNERLPVQRGPSQVGRPRVPTAGTGHSRVPSGTLSRSVMGRAMASPPPPEDPRWTTILEEIKNEVISHRTEMASFKAFKDQLTVEQITSARSGGPEPAEPARPHQASTAELESLRSAHARERQDWEIERMKQERAARELREDLRIARDDLGRERETTSALRSTMAQQANVHLTLETQVTALRMQAQQLQEEGQKKEARLAEMALMLERARTVVQEREAELREAEGLRRKLHNTVMELKGNIRVFCRVRPMLPHERENAEGTAMIVYPGKESREIVLSSSSETATGGSREAVLPFTFDRVFQPQATQAEVFEEISQLAQSCTDGYNVCIFGYGQTSSGKTYTMEGGSSDEAAGMIPRAVRQIFDVTEELASKGWRYRMEGQFLEIYNETVNDLLGVGELDKKKHEIKHEKNGRTTVTDVVTVPLESASQVRNLLLKAQSRRTVHATLMNERSSRSHSVFTLRVAGSNPLTGESCEGCLNLVDLAGSERLASSGAASDKDRLRETQAINKSLSALGDVIAALGEKGAGSGAGAEKGHVPYRNSKLTYLLQNSLSGNSKTLMVLNLSPLAAHLNESLCSLRFATKVNNTQIGTARKQQARISS